MRKSPTIFVRKHELEDPNGPNTERPEGDKLLYVAQLFRTTLVKWPDAFISIVGNTHVGWLAVKLMNEKHGIPEEYFTVTRGDTGPQYDRVTIGIIYFSAPPGTQSVKLEFEFDLGEIIELEYEVSPDGAYIEEVSGNITLLEKMIKQKAFGGRVRDIKAEVKAEFAIAWEREVSTKVEIEITKKLTASLGATVKLPGGTKINVELYGSFFRKFPGGTPPKGAVEGGIILSFPF